MSEATANWNILSGPAQGLRALVASLPSFLDLVEKNDPADAINFVHIVSTPRDPSPSFALVDFSQMERERIYINNGRQFEQRDGSSIMLYLRKDVTGIEEPAAILSFLDTVDGIWQQLEMGAGDYSKFRGSLAINRIRILSAPFRITKERKDRAGDYYECVLELDYSRLPQ